MTAESVQVFALASGAGIGIAAVIKQTFDGWAKIIRARRGDPELPSHWIIRATLRGLAASPELAARVIEQRDDVPQAE